MSVQGAIDPAPLTWDPFDEAIDTDPYDIWRRMRDEAPVYINEQHGFYGLSRYHDVESAHRQPLLFSSNHGTVLEVMGPNLMQGGMMIFRDPPEHTALRSLVNRAFTPNRIAALEERIRSYCRDLLAPWVAGETFDYVEQFASPLPAMVIAELLSIPDADRPQARKWIDEGFYIEPGVGMINDRSITAMFNLHVYLQDLLRERAANPGDDMLSALTQAEITHDGVARRLTNSECADFAVLLISAGTETVGKLLGWAALLLGEQDDQRQILVDEPGVIPNAIEELLRYEAPSPVQGRWTTDDVELHGVHIPANSKVLLLTGSAGRDERKYENAHLLDVRRKFDHHVSFGFGIHFCLGAALARLEGRVGLEETLAHMPRFASDRANAVQWHTSTVRGWHSVPVTS
ncbi:MAG: cytochrome [Ilumatobacteraceae bacterium]|nr:cytochrome [Ilumatobacteraceae bacterium]MCU1388589.1 cytochrome [Ilumatobacteraceae bacterium]